MGVRLFASAREAAGAANDVVEADTVGGALAVLRDRYGADFSAVLETARVWVNGDEPEMGDATPLHDGELVAVVQRRLRPVHLRDLRDRVVGSPRGR